MPFTYSCFFSYRRNEGEHKFIKNFNKIIESTAHLVTNKPKTFFDESSIFLGQEFDLKIYDAISESYFFILMGSNIYLNKSNDWCAKELYRAIKVEEKIKEKTQNYCFIYPFVQIGENISLPKNISNKNAIKLRKLKVSIINEETTEAIVEFKDYLYNVFLANFELINNVDFKDELKKISIPTDEELHQWIDNQLDIARKEEVKKIPILKN
jgi:hypothetical protein